MLAVSLNVIGFSSHMVHGPSFMEWSSLISCSAYGNTYCAHGLFLCVTNVLYQIISPDDETLENLVEFFPGVKLRAEAKTEAVNVLAPPNSRYCKLLVPCLCYVNN